MIRRHRHVDLCDLQQELEETYLELKDEKKRTKKTIDAVHKVMKKKMKKMGLVQAHNILTSIIKLLFISNYS